jgi:uncharacterized protein YndB with AHSA1/START domain
MNQDSSFTATFSVGQSPEKVFSAINNVRGWWSEEIEGRTEKLGDEFMYHYQDVHRCKMRIIESVPGKKVVWQVLENDFSFIKDKREWLGTTITFDIAIEGSKTLVRFRHVGLVLEYECYDVCSNAWNSYVGGSLRDLITIGKGKPNVKQASSNDEDTWGGQSFATSFTVDKSPEDVFDAINDVRGWWTGEIQGGSDKVGDEFSYRYEDLHLSKQKVTELVPGKKIVWHVVNAALSYTHDKAEWTGTDITFGISRKGDRTEVLFTHVGLVPQLECFEDCSSAWRSFVNGSLHNFISGNLT